MFAYKQDTAGFIVVVKRLEEEYDFCKIRSDCEKIDDIWKFTNIRYQYKEDEEFDGGYDFLPYDIFFNKYDVTPYMIINDYGKKTKIFSKSGFRISSIDIVGDTCQEYIRENDSSFFYDDE